MEYKVYNLYEKKEEIVMALMVVGAILIGIGALGVKLFIKGIKSIIDK